MFSSEADLSFYVCVSFHSSIFFPLRVDPILEGLYHQGKQPGVTKDFSHCKIGGKRWWYPHTYTFNSKQTIIFSSANFQKC